VSGALPIEVVAHLPQPFVVLLPPDTASACCGWHACGIFSIEGHPSGEERDMKSILDPKFKYKSSVNTNLAKTFARVRREQREAAKAAAQVQAADAAKVVTLPNKTATTKTG
jgi:hypothetical protein